MDDRIFGTNPVFEALSSGREIDKIFILEGARHSRLAQIISLAKKRGIHYTTVSRKKLDELSENGNHQGVLAFAAAHEYSTVDDILSLAKERDEAPFIIIAEGLSDPHNLGSIVRTANAAGAHGVIIPKNRSVGLTATVAKVSAGALEYTPVARVTNISSTIDELKKAGLWIAGTALEGSSLHYDADLTGALAIVIGSEGEGLSRLVREKCDFLVKIPMLGQAESLNASVAAGVLMYEAVRQRNKSK
ncbi:MAG: 23S rRNA (guanosine(2251)-2'-O)-methyltransferase RlmB [Ruminococcaceae bacterium]|nr:23S rRNA (guanosine(2251)-2'-O)-methyltransferase RlmB [Oscillospiraceae bacterium]